MDERSKMDGVKPENSTSASDTFQNAATDVKQVVRDAASDFKATAKEQTGAIKEKALSAIADAQKKAADQAGTAASTLRDTAAGLNGELPWMRKALNKTADGLDNLTSAFATGDFEDALETIKGFARRQPALFLGLSVAAGFALARVGKAALENIQPPVQPAASNGAATPAPTA